MTAFPSILIQQLPANLAAKTLLMAHYEPLRALDAKVKLLFAARPSAITSTQLTNALCRQREAHNADDDDELQCNLIMTQVPMGHQIRALKAAPLADKLLALAFMPIIDVQYAAVSMGLTEPAFNHFIAFHHHIFGQRYMNQRRYSMVELLLIESNPEWLKNYRKSPAPAVRLKPNDAEFVRHMVVEEKVGMAFANITRDELPKIAYVTCRVPAYYLCDLEKIRVAKLKEQEQ